MSKQPEQPSSKSQQRTKTAPEAYRSTQPTGDESLEDHCSDSLEETEEWDIEDLPTELIVPPELSNVFEDRSVLSNEMDAKEPLEQPTTTENASHFEQMLGYIDTEAPTEVNPKIHLATEQWKRLHPSSLFINILPQMWSTIRNAWPILLLILAGGEGAGTQIIDMVFVSIFLAISMLRTAIHFFTLRYRISPENKKLEIKMGLLVRHARTVDPNRIQNIEMVQNPLHKLAGLVELRIETAGDASTRGLLSALKVEDARSLRKQLIANKDLSTKTDDASEQEPLRSWPISLSEILLFGFSKRTVGTIVVITIIGSEWLIVMDPNEAQRVAFSTSLQSLLGILMIAFAGSWFWSAGKSVLINANYMLERFPELIRIRSGLLTRRSTEIPLSKVQLVEVVEPWLRRRMEFSSIYIETAAFGMADGELRKSEGVVPMTANDQLEDQLQHIIPPLSQNPWSVPLLPAHPRALYRVVFRHLIQAIVVSAFGLFMLPNIGHFVLLSIPIAVVIGWLDWKKQGWLVSADNVISRKGYLTRRTWILDREKIQSCHIIQSPIMRIHNLCQVVISAAGSSIALPDISKETALEVVTQLRLQWGCENERELLNAGD